MSHRDDADRDLGRRLREERKRRGSVPQAVVAREAGMSLSTYGRIERGEDGGNANNRRRLLEWLGDPTADIGEELKSRFREVSAPGTPVPAMFLEFAAVLASLPPNEQKAAVRGFLLAYVGQVDREDAK